MEHSSNGEINKPVFDLLSDKNVSAAYALAVETAAQINSAKKTAQESGKDQADVLLDMTQAFSSSDASKIKEYMDSPESELSPEERKELFAINEILSQNVSQLKPFFDTDGPLFLALRKNLNTELIEKGSITEVDRNSKRKIFEEIIEQEMTHYSEVFSLSQEVDPHNIVLALSAIVHDSAKFFNGVNEVGLHELLSTITGSQLIGAVLEQLKNENEKELLTKEQIAIVKKFAMRAIVTHGHQEFPILKSSKIVGGRVDVRQIFDGLIPIPDKTSLPEQSDTIQTKEDRFYTNSIAILNCVDMTVGSNNSSLKKYLKAYTTQFAIVASKDSLQDFVTKSIFASFESNLKGDSYQYLKDAADSNIATKLEAIRYKDMVQGGLFLLLVGIPLSDFFNPVKDEIMSLYNKSNLKTAAKELEEQFLRAKDLYLLVERQKNTLKSQMGSLVKSTTLDASYGSPFEMQKLLLFKEAVKNKQKLLLQEQDRFRELFIHILGEVGKA